MTLLPRRPVEFNRQRDSSCHARNHPKEKSQPDCIAETKYDGVCYRSGEQPQGPVFAAQQIVSQVQGTQHVEARRRDTYAGQQVMIDGVREKHALIVEGNSLRFQKLLPPQSEFSLRLCFFLNALEYLD